MRCCLHILRSNFPMFSYNDLRILLLYMDFQIIILYIGVINDNKFMKVRLQSRVNSRCSSLPNVNCGSILGWAHSGSLVPNPVQELESHKMNLIWDQNSNSRYYFPGKLYPTYRTLLKLKTMCDTHSDRLPRLYITRHAKLQVANRLTNSNPTHLKPSPRS